MVEYRIRTVLNAEDCNKSKKSSVQYALILVLSSITILFSLIYTFESYNINPTKVENTFTIDSQTDYIELRQDNSYDLFIDGKYVITLDSIPEELFNLPLHK